MIGGPQTTSQLSCVYFLGGKLFHDCHPGSSSNQKYAYLFVQMREKLSHWSNSFANAYRCRNFEEAQNSIRRMTYYERVNEEIVKKL